MSRARWVFSALLVLHVSAMALGAIPAPESLHPGFPARGPTNDPVAASLTGPVDSLARVVYRVAAVLSDATAPVSRASRSYLRSMGLGQQWTMFWNPPKEDEYLRLRYYVGKDGSARPDWFATEVVFPVQVDDRFRILSSYWTKQQDKAISIAFDNFIRKRSPHLTTRADVTTAELPSDLIPVRRYFERRFSARHLQQGEQVLRTEIWSGTAPIPLRGAALDRATVRTRLDFLKPYYLAPVEDRFPGESYPPYYAFEREGDIVWLLQYFEQR